MNNTNDFNLKKVLPAVLTIAIGMLLVMMDTTIMNVSLPHIQSAFHQNLSNSQWVIPRFSIGIILKDIPIPIGATTPPVKP